MPDALRPTRPNVPDRVGVEGLEAKWVERWDAEGTYRFDPAATRDQIYSIDAPPPTVSGALHIGHVFSYTHTDIVARHWRMRGKVVFYPMGWDDNGLATERRVENFFGVRGDADLAYDEFFEPPASPAKEKVAVSRRNFVELCRRLTTLDEESFKHVFRTLGSSIDWTMEYTTVSAPAQAISQRGFLSSLARGEVYSAVAPTLWDIDFRTPVSQAELVDKERPGHSHRVRFGHEAGDLMVETTRPELLPSCVAARRAPRRRALRRAVRHDRDDPALPRPGPGRRPRAGRPREGHGARDDLHLRRRHRRHVVARAQAAGARADRPRRPVPARPTSAATPSPATTRPRPTRSTRSSRASHVAQARAAVVEALRASGDLVGEPDADHPPGQVLREGRPAPRDRHSAASGSSPPSPTATRCSSAASSWSGTPTTCATATARGSRGSTSTGRSRASASSACPSRSGTRSTPRAASTTTRRSLADASTPAGRPAERDAPEASTSPSAASPAASSATPT